MGRIQVDIPDELESEFKKIVLKKYHSKRIKEHVKEAIEKWIKEENKL